MQRKTSAPDGRFWSRPPVPTCVRQARPAPLAPAKPTKVEPFYPGPNIAGGVAFLYELGPLVQRSVFALFFSASQNHANDCESISIRLIKAII